MSRTLVFLAALLLLTPPALPQEPTGLARLGFLAGTWQAEGEAAGVGRFTEEYAVAWRHERSFLALEYVWKAADGRTLRSETMWLGWDPAAQKTVTWHFGSDGSAGRGLETEARPEGVWVWEGRAEGRARREQFRLTLVQTDADSFVLRTELRKEPTDPWQAWSSSRFRRVAGAAAGAEPATRPPDRSLPDPGLEGPGRMVRIVLDRHAIDASAGSAFDLAARYRDGDVAVSAGDLWGANGLTVVGAGANFAAGLRAQAGRNRTHETSQSFLVVMEGGEASFRTVEIAPVVRDVVIPVYRGAVVVRTIQEEITGSGFNVRIHRATPHTIDLELTPWFHRARKGDILVVTELATRLTVIPGQPYAILAQRANEDSVASWLLSYREGTRRMEAVYVLTAQLEGR